jgi:hypothetical protein
MALGSTKPLVKVSTRNIPGGKGSRCVRLTTPPPSYAERHEIWEPKTPGTLWATPGLLRDCFNFTFSSSSVRTSHTNLRLLCCCVLSFKMSYVSNVCYNTLSGVPQSLTQVLLTPQKVISAARLVTLLIWNKNERGTASTGIMFIKNCHKISSTFYSNCCQGLTTT